ncbi:hypothetical protein CLOM_g367 [Closterium sp. NIES-68]|nr:hypothetical protein CLOM_g367 [Closterium sp. NIES-68]GJP72192.1 hypothetical protein CLOP_g2941 [Closterium sp. NIES-67]
MAAHNTSLGQRGILEEGGAQPGGPIPLSTSAGSPPRGIAGGSPPRGGLGGALPQAGGRPASRSEKLVEMGGGLGGETRIFARGQTIFWRLLQVATAAIALGVMIASSANGMFFQYYQAFIFMVAAMTAVAAWCLAHLLHSIGRLMTRKWRITLFALLDFLVAWIALAGASAAAGLTTFADKGSGMVQPGYCQMGLFSSFCARTKAATAFAFITFFVLIPSLIASATRAVVSWFEDQV